MIHRSKEINQLLEKLRAAYKWLMIHQDDQDTTAIEGLLNRAGAIVDRLEELGINRQASTELLMFGKEILAE